MVDAAVTAMAYWALELTTPLGPFIKPVRPCAVGEVFSGSVTSSDTAGGFAVKLSRRDDRRNYREALKTNLKIQINFSSRLATPNQAIASRHDVPMMRYRCSERVTCNKAYQHADDENGQNELCYVRITHSEF